MCILFVYTNPRPEVGKYRLVLASNRDEYFVRNAKEAEIWPDNTSIISGIDMEPGREGGTWLGLSVNKLNDTKKGIIRVGALLNLTGEQRLPKAEGRGFIVTDYLKNSQFSADQYIINMKSKKSKYNAFNFVALQIGDDIAETYHYSNIGKNEVTKFDSNVSLGFGNSLPDMPLNKVKNGQKRFQEIVTKYGDISQSEQLVSELLGLLKWNERHLPDEELKRRAPDSFEYLSSIYVHIPVAGYGTRTHTIIMIDWLGKVHYTEYTMKCPIDVENPEWVKNYIKSQL